MFSLYYNRSYLQTRLALKINYECEKQTIKSSELVCWTGWVWFRFQFFCFYLFFCCFSLTHMNLKWNLRIVCHLAWRAH